MMQSLKPEDLARMREIGPRPEPDARREGRGGNPDFQGFMRKHGAFFPPGHLQPRRTDRATSSAARRRCSPL